MRNPSAFDALISTKGISSNNSLFVWKELLESLQFFQKVIVDLSRLIIHSLSDLHNNPPEEQVFHLFLVVQNSHFYS